MTTADIIVGLEAGKELAIGYNERGEKAYLCGAPDCIGDDCEVPLPEAYAAAKVLGERLECREFEYEDDCTYGTFDIFYIKQGN